MLTYQRKAAVGFLVIGAISATVFLWESLSGSPTEPRVAKKQKSACMAEIRSVQSVKDAMNIGSAYFGGDKGYDLGCARGGYGASLNLNERGDLLAWYQLGRIDFLEGKYEQALSKFAKQIELFGDGELPNVHYMVGLTYGYKARASGAAEDWQKAEDGFENYISFDKDSPWPRVDLAWIFFSQGKYKEMKAPLEAVIGKHPENPWLLNMYGLALLNTDEKDRAVSFFESAKRAAAKLTKEDWARTYPGNNPIFWEAGLAETRALIEKNLVLAQE